VERRVQEQRHRGIRERIQAGGFPELEDPEVSVVIPCYNQGRFLADALVSVFEQSFDSFEIIVVDDGSTDPDTVRILDALDFPRVRQLRQANRGLPGARNAGMEVARGRYLVPLDADDQLKPLFVETLLEAIQREPRAAYAHCWGELFGNIDGLFATRPFNPYWLTMVDSVIGCVLMRKEAWYEVGGYDETMVGEPEDWEMWIRLMQAGWGQVQVFEPLFRYRLHGVTLGVQGEVRFERGRRSVADRHRELYSSEGLRDLKQQWSPLMTVIGEANPLPDEAERISDPSGLATTWGKYVVDLRGADDVSAPTLHGLVDRLEADPAAASARTTGEPPVVVSRRWNLHDPDADPWKDLLVDDPATGVGAPPLSPRAGWTIPKKLRQIYPAVQRQRPEEAGRVPDLSRW
jgi:GT2 family glycosyltransferase